MARVNTLWVAGFTADTPVLMLDGKTKPISKVKEGEWVTSFDPKTKALRPGKVTGTLSEVMNEILEVTIEDKSMIVASSQRFFTPNGEWKTAPDAEAVLGIDGQAKKISAKKVKGLAKIYDITVRGDHAFFADGIMVHNGGGGGGSPPKPPPDPVVTAGKIGRPLTVTVNGNQVSVPASPGSSGQVSVSHTGGVTTSYHSTPGVPANPMWPFKPLPFQPRPARNLGPYNAIVSASQTRDGVCESMSNFNGAVSAATKRDWQSSLRSMRSDVQTAKRSDVNSRQYGGYGEKTNWVNSQTGGPDPMVITRADRYDEIFVDIKDLEQFLGKNKNFTAKDQEFIRGKCAELESNLTSLKNSLNNNGGPIRSSDPDPTPGRDYSNEPGYAYYYPSGDGSYYFQPPSQTTPDGRRTTPLGLVGFYKHFDTTNGLFYYDREKDNAV